MAQKEERGGEVMKPLMTRVKTKHRVMIKKLAEKNGKGEGEVVREAIEEKFKKEG